MCVARDAPRQMMMTREDEKEASATISAAGGLGKWSIGISRGAVISTRAGSVLFGLWSDIVCGWQLIRGNRNNERFGAIDCRPNPDWALRETPSEDAD